MTTSTYGARPVESRTTDGWRVHASVDDSSGMRYRRRHPYLALPIALGAVFLGACQSGVTDFANRLVGTDGQRFTVEDLEAIADDPGLTDEEKRQAFRDLGIADEELIEALLTL